MKVKNPVQPRGRSQIEFRVLRAGSYGSERLRLAKRFKAFPRVMHDRIGIRLALKKKHENNKS